MVKMTGTSARYTTYAVCLMALVNLVNYADRMLISVLVPSIKADLGLTDGQIGWLTGMAFAMLYGVAGIDIARIADTWVRKYLISVSISAWSVMTMLSGAATNFTTKLAARIGVGVGEAGCVPAGHSIISDLLPKEKRAGGLGVFAADSAAGMKHRLVVVCASNDDWTVGVYEA